MRLVALLFILLIATPAAAKPPVWVVSDGDSQMMLFGSVHVLPPNLDWRPAELDAALSAADDIWFESPVGETAEREASFLALRAGALPQGETLSGKLSRRDAELLRETARRYGVRMETLDRFRPWFAEALLMQAFLGRDHGAYLSYGVETTIDRSAPAAAKREAFATNAEHLALLGGASEREQLASLRRTLQDLRTEPQTYAKATDAWMRGDLRWLRRHVLDEMRADSPSQFRRLTSERNARWAGILDKRLKGKGKTVVIVGMAHLIGPGSVPQRLRTLGYSVRGP